VLIVILKVTCLPCLQSTNQVMCLRCIEWQRPAIPGCQHSRGPA